MAFLLIFAFFAVTLQDDGFLSQTNLLNIVRQTTPVTVMAVAVVFVLSAGEIDLSIGSVVALSALVTADVMQSRRRACSAVAAGLGVGLGVGAVNGLFVTLLRLPSFLVTLATMGLVAGLARTITDLESVAVENQSLHRHLRLRRRRPDPGARASGRSAPSRSASSSSATGGSARTSSPPATTSARRVSPASASIGSSSRCSC